MSIATAVTATVTTPTASLLLESSNDWMWAVAADGRHTYTNGAIARILGYSPEEVLRLGDFSAIVHPDDRGRIVALLERSVERREGWAGEVFRWLHKDGSHRWLESHGNPLFDAEGGLAGFCGADRDITARMEQEQRLADSERRFRMTFEDAGVGIAHVGLDGTWLRVNQPLVDLLGYPREELMHLTFQDVTHPDDLNADLAQAERLFAGEIRTYSIEKRYIRKGGAVVWATLTGSVVRDESGAVEYAIAVVRDITDRKASEAAQRQSERDYRTLFANSHDVIVLVDPRTRTIVNVNRRAAEVYGHPVEDLIGAPLQTVSCDVEGGLRRLAPLFGGAPEVRFETVHRRRDGTLIELHAISALVQYGGREVILNTCRDVTEENRLLRVVAASERRFRSLIEHGYDIIEVIDAEGRIRFASGSIEQTLGWTPEELIDTHLADLVHPDDQPRVAEAIGKVVQSPELRPTVVCRVQTRDGGWRWCEGAGVNMLDVEGVAGIVVIARDITERRELEAQVEQSRRVESLGQIAASVAHEFNNVLMAIQPAADVLQRRHGATPDIARIARQLDSAVKRGRVIAGGILRFANPVQPVRHELEVRPWLTAVAEELRSIVGGAIDVAAIADPSLVVLADADQLHQLITNLVLNARDAMPQGGSIRITAERAPSGHGSAGGWAEIAVHDSGPGVPAELRSRIFDPLFTTRRKGTGLGLSLCHQIATAHGGSISVDGEPGSGAVFRVRLPARSSAASATAERPRALLVEDDEAVAASLMFALEDVYETDWSSRGEGVVERVRTATPALVLLDVQLPDADGRELYAGIREQSLDVPVVLMSGNVSVAPATLDRRAAFLAKPFATAELLETAAALAAR